ncbi:hypothetical protein EP331_02950 [bacterium]|nr:MAG: hypothetical protein EP331_02950 [bacterium]
MPEFKVFTRIQAPYSKVWELVSVVNNIEKWSPVKFTSAAPDESIRNGLKLMQVQKQFGVFGRKNLFVHDAFMNSKVRRQYSFVDESDTYRFNRLTYMFDDNSISTMIQLSEDLEARKILEEQAKTEPEFQIDIMAHVFYTFGSAFWKQAVEYLFIAPFFKFVFQKKVERSLAKLKQLAES